LDGESIAKSAYEHNIIIKIYYNKLFWSERHKDWSVRDVSLCRNDRNKSEETVHEIYI